MQRHTGWWWFGIDMGQAASYKYSEGDINSARQFSKAAVLMCVRDGDDVPGTYLEEEDFVNHNKSVTDANGGKKRSLQSPQQRRKFAKGEGTLQEEEEISMETENAGNM